MKINSAIFEEIIIAKTLPTIFVNFFLKLKQGSPTLTNHDLMQNELD